MALLVLINVYSKMILGIIIIFISVVIITLIVKYFRDKLNKEKSKISIKESIDLAQIPIITFKEGNKKFNFLLDSGSSDSHISENAASMLNGVIKNVDYTYTSSDNSSSINRIIESTLEYKNEKFKVNLLVNNNLNSSFDTIKSNCGIQLHGILGTNFLEKYKYILDFAKLVVYHK